MNAQIPNFLLLSHPILNILVLIYQTLYFLRVPFALGFSIIVLTVFIRLILYPLTASQLKASKKMQEVAPHIAKLKEKHKGDSKMIQSETMRVYKEFGINPAAGCLPILLQLPLIWALYQVLQDIVKYSATQINHVLYSDSLKLTKNWDTTFFGLSLAGSPNHMFNINVVNTWPILLVPVLTGVFQFIQSKMMMAATPKKEEGKLAAKEKKSEDFATAFQSQSLYIFPFMIGFLSFQFPIGLSLYWNTFTIFGIIQQYKISGLGGLEELIKKWKKK